MKEYTHYATVQIVLFPSTKNGQNILLKDVINGSIICNKPMNYIKAIGLECNTPYLAELAFYTNKNGYLEADFLKGKVYSYVPVETKIIKSQQENAAAKPKPSWLR
jgi:hypothetical protein